jgi:hypothetical protein
VNDENGDLLADSQNNLNRWRNSFSQLLNVNSVSDDRQIEIHTAELVLGPSHLEVEIPIAKLKKYKSSGSNQIPAELNQAGSETLVFVFYKVINSIWNKLKLPEVWEESVIVPVHKKGYKTNCNNYCARLL